MARGACARYRRLHGTGLRPVRVRSECLHGAHRGHADSRLLRHYPRRIVSTQERFGWEDEHLVMGLFSAGAIGYVIANNSFISGAEGGCQAEVGSAIGMAAGALTERGAVRRSKRFMPLDLH